MQNERVGGIKKRRILYRTTIGSIVFSLHMGIGWLFYHFGSIGAWAIYMATMLLGATIRNIELDDD